LQKSLEQSSKKNNLLTKHLLDKNFHIYQEIMQKILEKIISKIKHQQQRFKAIGEDTKGSVVDSLHW
jgi:hypothetical protein